MLTINIDFIHAMYQLMKGAAVHACSGNGFHHDPEDITTLGGAAYNIYANDLKIPLMPTSDIDMTWWPRFDSVIPPKELTRLSSLVLQSIPKESTEWNVRIGSVLGVEVSKIEFELEDVRFPPNHPDVIMNRTIELSMIMNGNQQFKNICSLVIRNALNNQEYTTNHHVVGKKEFGMRYDPTYCDQQNTAIIGSSRVPQLIHFTSQQLFSYKNLLLTSKIDKANIQLQRIINIYLKVNSDVIVSQFIFVYNIILAQRPSAIESFMQIVGQTRLWNDMMRQHQQRLAQQHMMPPQQQQQPQPPQQQPPQQQQQPQPPQQQPPQQQPNISGKKLTIEEAKAKLKQIIDGNKPICAAFKKSMQAIKNNIYSNYTDNIRNSTKYEDSVFTSFISKYKEIGKQIEKDQSVGEEFKAVNRQLMAVFDSNISGGSRKKRTIKRKKNKSKTKKRSTR